MAEREVIGGREDEPMAKPEEFVVRPVGVVRSPLADRASAPRRADKGGAEAVLVLEPRVRSALRGLAVGDEIIVLTWLHEAARDVLEVYPGRDPSRPLAGVFATRSPDRPNPIGLHRVTVTSLDGRHVGVRPLEAIDGTPVIDIKPVLRRVDDA
jgi:tRNA-Thr(GGU) m(6)t(6)A37 methyltransferase TsaA